MTHLPTIINDLALILLTAGVTTILFKWLKQPLVLGYIIAGFLVGPHMNLFPSVIDGESIEAERIEHLISPLKNLFGAVFFVSVGMMIAPALILEYIVPILILTIVVFVGRIIFATIGVFFSGESLKTAVQSGFSLAQIGEFSFIIATLGIQLGVLSNFIYPIIVAVSVITTFTTPYCINYSEKVYNQVQKISFPKVNTGIIYLKKDITHSLNMLVCTFARTGRISW